MGMAIRRSRFGEEEYERFAQRLEACLEALGRLLGRPGFGEGPATVGAELEVFLVDREGRPLPVNQKVLAETVDPRLTYELDRFNLECNLAPGPLAGAPFTALRRELENALGEVRRAAAHHRGRVALIGILPTLRPEDVAPPAMTDVPRYHALSAGLRRRRAGSFAVDIDGAEPLRATCDDVTFEGANTSFQLHLRVPPRRFAAVYNAAQAATPVALAVAGNSPTFLGHRLWEETRIALFEQSVDDRTEVGGRRRGPARVSFGSKWLEEGALELFAESVQRFPPLIPVLGDEDPLAVSRAGGVPGLPELRLHQGTVWRWNRPVYDPADGGHLRVEMRALPSGPTTVDMVANGAFLLGLTLALARDGGRWVGDLPFGTARGNFYQAARSGLEARLAWPGIPGRTRARDLVRELLPLARRGLEEAGVETRETAPPLELIAERAERGQTGAVWQRRTLAALEERLDRREALRVLLGRYLSLSEVGDPVHAWPVEEAP